MVKVGQGNCRKTVGTAWPLCAASSHHAYQQRSWKKKNQGQGVAENEEKSQYLWLVSNTQVSHVRMSLMLNWMEERSIKVILSYGSLFQSSAKAVLYK